MVQIDPGYQAASGPLTPRRGIEYCRDYAPERPGPLIRARLLIVRQLTGQPLQLEGALAEVTAALHERVQATRTPLLAACGVGEILAARILGELGATPRVRSAAALAALAGVAPGAVSSGGRSGHRLSRGGNRRLNRVLHVIALVQRRCDPRAQAYYAKKRAEGKAARAAMRCLKRRLVDVLFRVLQQPATPTPVAA